MHFNVLQQTKACGFNGLQEVGMTYGREASRVSSVFVFFFSPRPGNKDEFHSFISVYHRVPRDP